MNLKGIKTRDQLNEFADIWYQRSHQLRVVWQGLNEPLEKRLKAYSLWQIMYKRVMNLVQIAIKINQPKPKKNELN